MSDEIRSVFELQHRVAVARGDEPPDLVLKGGRVLSVFSGEVFDGDVAVAGEHIAGIGAYDGPNVVDVSGHVLDRVGRQRAQDVACLSGGWPPPRDR